MAVGIDSGDGTASSPFVLTSGQSNITLTPGVYYTLNGSLSGVSINGANLTLNSTSSVTGNINFSGGTPANPSQLTIVGTASAQATQNGLNAPTYVSPTPIANALVTNFGNNSTITLPDITMNLAKGVDNGSGAIKPMVVSGNYPTSGTNLTISINDGSGSSQYVIAGSGHVILGCFLRGTRIATPGGEVAVESLRIGDEVSAIENGERITRKVKWIGVGTMNAAEHEFDASAYPVRIKAGAFAENVPHRDLLLTNEHGILIDGKLVPVRMLVNRQSILIDRSLPVYEYYHIELDQHAILLSEGLTTESYLAGSNLETFDNLDTARSHEGVQILAAPLAVDRETVEVLWNKLLDHARKVGLAPMAYLHRFDLDHNLRVVLDDGTELRGEEPEFGIHTFRVPAGKRPISLLSNFSKPSEVIGPFVDDRRDLGVAISHLEWSHGGETRRIEAANLETEGWHGLEGSQRWTNGAASLALLNPREEDALLTVKVVAKLTYAAGTIIAKAA